MNDLTSETNEQKWSDSSSGSSKQSKVVSKTCQVCGDSAKSYHFGGLCCESCKAFFRRAMHNNSYVSFSCSYGRACEIRLDNRRCCQFCRLQKCYKIGMDKGWLRSEQDLIKLKELRMNRLKDSQNLSSSSTPKQGDKLKYLSEEEITEIEKVVSLYWQAYREVGFGPEAALENGSESNDKIISMMTTGIRRWAAFCKSLPAFTELSNKDQTAIFNSAAMQVSILRAVISFDPKKLEWRVDKPVNHYTPSLDLKDIQHFLTPSMISKHLCFINSMKKMEPDESIIMLLSLVTLFSNDVQGLDNACLIASVQDSYILMLQRYIDWKYGPSDGKKILAFFLSMMSDLRELSDLHRDYKVKLSEQELFSIHQQIEMAPAEEMSINTGDELHFFQKP